MAEGGGGLFSSYRSKHKSESGNWEKDSDHPNCGECGAPFTFTRRRHHCRRCGRIYCGKCCDNQVFIDGLSRSGKPKRICDDCFRQERGGGPEDEADGLGDEARDSMPSAEATAASAGGNLYAHAKVTEEEAVANLEALTAFEGSWTVRFTFKKVEMGGALMASDAHVYLPGATAAGGAANLIAPGKKKKRRSGAQAALVPGARRSVDAELQKKGSGYFKGTCTALSPFGDEGTLNGSLQRMTGKVQFQLTFTNAAGITMQINLTGVVNKKREVVGTFSGTEIAKDAGTVAGTFTFYCPDDSVGEEEELAAEEAEEAAAVASEATPEDGEAGEGASSTSAFSGAVAE